MIILRDYQEHAINDLRDAYKKGLTAPLLVAPTGSGKTVLFSYVAYNAAKKGNNVLILVHRQELLNQTSETLDSLGVKHGLISRGMSFSRASVQVASVQTLIRRLDSLAWKPNLIVVDEAHHATGKTTWGKIIAYYDSAAVLGVTATPERLDGQGLGKDHGGYFDALVHGPTVSDLVERGYLSPPVVFAPSMPDLSGVHTRMGDYAKKELAGAMDKPSITGDAVKHYKKHCDGEPAIAFCCNVAHAEHVAALFSNNGFNAASIDGKMDNSTRKQRIKDLAEGRLNILTSCDIISEGTDIPVVSAALLLRPTQSTALCLQQMGRALRPFPGKKRALILDHAGNCLRHGLPDDEREWTLEGRTRKQKKQDEADLKVKQCPECFHVHMIQPECPACGYRYAVAEREIMEVDGELQEITAAMRQKIARKEQGGAKGYADLVGLGFARKYKNPYGWASKVMSSRARSLDDLRRLGISMKVKDPEAWAAFVWSTHKSNKTRMVA